MANKQWEQVETCFCAHADMDVNLEVETIYPADFLGDTPRLGAHRCSNAVFCNQFNQGACIYTGTNPDIDPFQDS